MVQAFEALHGTYGLIYLIQTTTNHNKASSTFMYKLVLTISIRKLVSLGIDSFQEKNNKSKISSSLIGKADFNFKFVINLVLTLKMDWRYSVQKR